MMDRKETRIVMIAQDWEVVYCKWQTWRNKPFLILDPYFVVLKITFKFKSELKEQ